MSTPETRPAFVMSMPCDGKAAGSIDLLGNSKAFLDAMRLVRRFANTTAHVMVYGETGTGKELVARAIHYFGPRRYGPFVPVNCGALPDNLIENELFGHARGAYTDARGGQNGLVAGADGGTLFLDEVECLSPKGQVALLRFLQDGSYRPLGSCTEVNADVRVVAASNQDMEQMVREAAFRQDLLYRLAIMAIELPPLRDRGDDVLLLAEHFIACFTRQYQTATRRLEADSAAQALAYDWPGNIRELENLIHRQFLLADDGVVRLGLPAAKGSHGTGGAAAGQTLSHSSALDMKSAKAQVIERFERDYLERIIAETHGNVSLAAQRAGKERRAFGKLLKKYGINRSLYL